MKKKIISLLMAVLIAVSVVMPLSSFAATTDFIDVDNDNEILVEAVDLLNYMGIVKGISDTEFGAEEPVTREQFALFVYRLMKGGKDAPSNATNTTEFTDLEDPTYFYAISWANAAGIVNGRTDSIFAPKDRITLQEAYAMLTRALEWENEDTVYPYGNIELAEQPDVELGEGLDSKIDYSDYLTRGDMAILLYNAFFAEMGIERTETSYETIGTGNKQVVVVNKETINPVLCEEKFGVQTLELQAVSTPHYALKDTEATYDFGYDAIYFRSVKDNFETYISAEDLGLENKNLDDYFLGVFTVYAEMEDKEIERVLFADCNMIKTVTNDITLGTVTSNKTDSYFEGTDEKLLSGKMTFDNTDVYVYDAPYTYAKGEYTTSSDEADKYFVRNKENLEFVNFYKEYDGDNYFYRVDITPIIDEDFSADPETLLETFYNVYYDGLYEATFYDVNADGIYDYINYIPYVFFQVDSDEDYDISDSETEEKIPYIYTNEASVSGKKFKNEDYVIGYYDINNEYVYIKEVIKPITTKVKKYQKSEGTITLDSGDYVDAVSNWKLVNNFNPITSNLIVNEKEEISAQVDNNALFVPSILDSKENIKFYIYDDVILYHTAENESNTYAGNLIIPIEALDVAFDKDTGKRTWYIKAFINGEVKDSIAIETEDVYPAIIENNTLTSAYENQLCTYTKRNGIYTISSLAFGEDEDGAPDCLSKEIEILNSEKPTDYIAIEDEVTMTKVAGSRFELSSETRKVELQANTEIIIRVPEDKNDEYEYLVFGKEDFNSSVETVFDTVTYILGNNTESNTKENLLVLYATVSEDFEFAGKTNKTSYRIICGNDLDKDEDGEYRNFYTVINPFTGENETDIPSKYSATKASNIITPIASGLKVKLIDGYVDEKKAATSLEETVWITDYDVNDKYITIANDNEYCEDCIEENSNTYIEIDKNTTIMVIKADTEEEIFDNGVLTTVDNSILENAKKEYKCYNSKTTDKNNNFKTEYASYLRAYVSYDDTDLEEDEVPVAEYIIIVVYEDSNITTDNTCDNH